MRNKNELEMIRQQGRERFDKVRQAWLDCGKWALPYRIQWMLSQEQGQRNNNHVVDTTHVLALRSFVAGFLEGNTSATRPWFRVQTPNPEDNLVPENHKWLDALTRLSLSVLNQSNFYDAAGQFYYDYGVFNTGTHFIDEINGGLFFHTLTPGSYYVLNNGLGEANCLVREFSMNVKAIVDLYGTKNANGKWDWSNFSTSVRKMYEESNYSQKVGVVQVVIENEDFNPSEPIGGKNRQWVSKTYEVGRNQAFIEGQDFGSQTPDINNENLFLKISYSKRKPFIVGKSQTSSNFEYGEKGPTLDALGLIKSLNKKAISKDQAIEQMLRPAIQGPANLKKSYITTASNAYVPLDAHSLSQKGLRTVYEVNPAIGGLTQDVEDLRRQVDQHYYADFLLFLSRNPKTRTATETNAVLNEQQLVIGPNLQSLNWTYNTPVVEFVIDFVIDEDPNLPPPPPDLQGKFLRPEFISVFAQAQRAADLPAVNQYMAMISEVSQINPGILDKANLDKLADIYEDRLYLPEGLNNSQDKTEALRQQAQAQAQRQQKLEAMTQVASAAKDIGLQVNQNKGEQ